MKYQIRREDKHNWTIYEWQNGGDIITRGKYVGEVKQAKWIPLNGGSYHQRLEHVAKALLDYATGANCPEGNLTAKTVLAAIEKAQGEVMDTFRDFQERADKIAEALRKAEKA